MKYLLIIVLPLILLCSERVFSQDSAIMQRLSPDYQNAKEDSVRLSIILKVIESSGLDDIDTALYLIQKGTDIAAVESDTVALIRLKSASAKFATVRNRYSEALKSDLEALELAKSIYDTLRQVSILNAIGEDYSFLDFYDEAFNYYNESLRLAVTKKYTLREAVATFNIGKLYLNTGELEKAREFLLQSKSKSLEINDTLGIAYTKNELAQILIRELQYDSALNELSQAYEISTRLNEDILTPEIVLTMSEAFVKKGNYEVAQIHYDQALAIYESLESRGGMAKALLGKAGVYALQKELFEARKNYEQALSLAREVNDNELLLNIYLPLAEIYESESNLPLALDYFKKYSQLDDSLSKQKKNDQFAELQLRLESAKKDAEILALNQKEKSQEDELKQQEFIRNILVVILAFTGVLLFSLFKNNRRRQKTNELLLVQQKEIEAKTKELTSLLQVKDKFFSIVSHDLRSPINSLIGLLEILDKDSLTEKEMREMSHALKSRLTGTKKLLDTLLDWAMLQMNEIKIKPEKINLSEVVKGNFKFFEDIEVKTVSFENNIPENIFVSADKNMLELIIRNILSNALKFTQEGGTIKVAASDNGNEQLTVSISDDGVGMSKDQADKLFDTSELYTTRGTANEKGTGLGLKLCKEFIERMGGNIWVESTEGEGSIFNFTLHKS